MEENLELSEIVKNHYITELQKHLEKESKKFTDNFTMLLNERLQIKANTIHQPSEIRPQFNLTIIYDKEKKEKNEDDIVLCPDCSEPYCKICFTECPNCK